MGWGGVGWGGVGWGGVGWGGVGWGGVGSMISTPAELLHPSQGMQNRGGGGGDQHTRSTDQPTL